MQLLVPLSVVSTATQVGVNAHTYGEVTIIAPGGTVAHILLPNVVVANRHLMPAFESFLLGPHGVQPPLPLSPSRYYGFSEQEFLSLD